MWRILPDWYKNYPKHHSSSAHIPPQPPPVSHHSSPYFVSRFADSLCISFLQTKTPIDWKIHLEESVKRTLLHLPIKNTNNNETIDKTKSLKTEKAPSDDKITNKQLKELLKPYIKYITIYPTLSSKLKSFSKW